MNEKLLEKDKVIEAVWKARHNMNFGYQQSQYVADGNVMEALNVNIRIMAQDEAKKIINVAFDSFVSALTMELENCETDKYPCALCFEAENETL